MSGTEYYSKCPNCGKAAMSKRESSDAGFRFDACPHCMFLYSTAYDHCPTVGRVDTWTVILNAYDTTLAKLRSDLLEVKEENLERSVFSYSETSEKEMKALTKLGGCDLFEFNRANYKFYYNHAKPSVRVANKIAAKMAKINSAIDSEFDDCIAF